MVRAALRKRGWVEKFIPKDPNKKVRLKQKIFKRTGSFNERLADYITVTTVDIDMN